MKQTKSIAKHRWLGILILIFLAVIFSCSTVFTASIQGKVKLLFTVTEGDVKVEKDKELKNVLVFLYDSKDKWENDFKYFNPSKPESSVPNAPEKTIYNYYQMTETNTQGEFSFSGFLWKTSGSDYGKTGDRREVYILLYHKDYGLYKNLSPIYIISNTTTTLPTFFMKEE